jgi:hypothetical protein
MNDVWNEYEACKHYIAIKNHFSKDSYNFLGLSNTYRGLGFNYSVTNYNKRKDKFFFRKASRYHNKEEFIKYVISNIIYGTSSKYQLDSLHMSSLTEENYNKLKCNIESLFYRFCNDINDVLSATDSFENIFDCSNGKMPILLQRNVSIETLTILDKFVRFSKTFDGNAVYYWPSIGYKVKNYNMFLEYFTLYDTVKYKMALMNKIKDCYGDRHEQNRRN